MLNIPSIILFCTFLLLAPQPLLADNNITPNDDLLFDDTLLEEPLTYPDWFTLSLGDLKDDLQEAIEKGKKGIIVYFGQRRCAYCEQFLHVNLASEDTQKYLRKHYDIVPVDIWGTEEFTDTDGKKYSERELASHYKTQFTPSLLFYNSDGKVVYRLRGYHPPYTFAAVLKYMVEEFYKKESLRDYLARAEPGLFFMTGGLNERDFFDTSTHNLKKILSTSNRPMAVFFEQGECHACDLLHSGPLNDPVSIEEISRMSAIQIDMWSNTPVITPTGVKTTAREWAAELELFYAPTIIFFDPAGKEIMRLDSVIQFYRLLGVLDYINRDIYLQEPDYQWWRLKQRRTH